MQRYFLKCSYLGTAYAGFQIQQNAKTVQGEIEKVLETVLRRKIVLTGSSRTDAGVHALQNYFHFDCETIPHDKIAYALNAMLPKDIAVLAIIPVPTTAHCRFDATARSYEYLVHWEKDPFLQDRAYYYPFKIDMSRLKEAAAYIMTQTDFTSFSKRNTQAFTNNCAIEYSCWEEVPGGIIYRVKGNRFLRGMVRGLVGTQLKMARGKFDLEAFKQVFAAMDCSKADFSVPGKGLKLVEVSYPAGYFDKLVENQ